MPPSFESHWVLAGAVAALLVLATEAGYQLRGTGRSAPTDASKAQFSTIQAAILGLLGLLLGFTFAMAVSRFDTRKQLVLEEANAIGTTYLRAQLLPAAHRGGIEAALRRYVDLRVEFYRAGADAERVHEAEARAQRMQREIWSTARAIAEEDPRAVTTALFLESLNEMIDVDAKRLAALENHVPETIWILLGTVAILAALMTGYGSRLGGRRNVYSTLAIPTVIAVVMTIIIDLDRPRRGLIRVSQGSLMRLQAELSAEAPDAGAHAARSAASDPPGEARP